MERPINRLTISWMRALVEPTAARAWGPTNCPTTMMSAALNSSCRMPERASGMANRMVFPTRGRWSCQSQRSSGARRGERVASQASILQTVFSGNFPGSPLPFARRRETPLFSRHSYYITPAPRLQGAVFFETCRWTMREAHPIAQGGQAPGDGIGDIERLQGGGTSRTP